MSNPYYFPDDKTFVFGGESPFSYPAIPNSDRNNSVMKKVRKELESKYKDNSIYVMQGNEQELKPYLVMPAEYQKKFKGYYEDSAFSLKPSLSADGSVLIFIAQGYTPDGVTSGSQLFQYSPDGNHRQITHLPLTQIQSHAVSPKGELLAVVYGAQERDKIVIYRVKDGTFRDIILPDQPSRIINSQ
jgi:hypothetical protein